MGCGFVHILMEQLAWSLFRRRVATRNTIGCVCEQRNALRIRGNTREQMESEMAQAIKKQLKEKLIKRRVHF
jgi:hypothetical protein